MRADGSGQRRLTDTPGYDGGPFFFPDGERIIWRRFSEDGVIADIWSMRLDGSDQRRLTDFGAIELGRPTSHPSGEYLLFASNKLGFSNFEVYLVDVEGRREAGADHHHRRVSDGLPVPTRTGAGSPGRPPGTAATPAGRSIWRTGITRPRSPPSRRPPSAPRRPNRAAKSGAADYRPVRPAPQRSSAAGSSAPARISSRRSGGVLPHQRR